MRADLADEALIAAKSIRPLERPPVGKLRTLQQVIDHTLALAGILVGEKAAHLVRSGQLADDIEKDAAQKLAIAAQRRRLQAQQPQLGEDMMIDVIVFGRRVPDEAGLGIAEDETGRGHLPQVLRRDRGLAGLLLLHQSARSNGGDRVIIDAEARQVRDLAPGAVAEARQDAELPARHRIIEDVARRRYFQAFERRSAGRIIAGALGDPATQQLILRITRCQTLAAFVRHLPGGFLQDETGRRIEAIQPAAVGLAR